MRGMAARILQALQDWAASSSSGAFSASKYANGKLDLHAYIVKGIKALPSQYQPPSEWYTWQYGKSPLSTGAS